MMKKNRYSRIRKLIYCRAAETDALCKIPVKNYTIQCDETPKYLCSGSERAFRDCMNFDKSTDVVVEIGEEKFPAHRNTLVTCSKYFHEHLKEHQSKIHVSDMSSDIFYILYQWMYTEELNVTIETVADVRKAALTLQIEAIVEQCNQYLERIFQTICPVVVLQKAQQRGLQELAYYTCIWLGQHFQDVTTSEDFLKLTSEQVRLMFALQHIHTNSEAIILDAAIRWLMHDWPSRRADTPEILTCIRFFMLKKHELEEITSNPQYAIILELPLVKNFLLSALQYSMLVDKRPSISSPRQLPEKCSSNQQKQTCQKKLTPDEAATIIQKHFRGYRKKKRFKIVRHSASVICQYYKQWKRLKSGGSNIILRRIQWQGNVRLPGCPTILLIFPMDSRRRTQSSVFRYNMRLNTWDPLQPLPFYRFYVKAAILDGLLYLTGGSGSIEAKAGVADTWVYHPDSDIWIQLSDMLSGRVDHSLVAQKKMLFAIGGKDDNGKLLQSMECFDSVMGVWQWRPPMRRCRYGMAAAAVSDHYIWIIGGVSEMESILCNWSQYNVDTNQWTEVKSLKRPRSFSEALIFQKHLYLIGGIESLSPDDGSRVCDKVDIFNIKDLSLTEELKLQHERYRASAVLLGDKLFVMGGNESTSSFNRRAVSSVECWDLRSKRWIRCVCPLPAGTTIGHVAVALDPDFSYVFNQI